MTIQFDTKVAILVLDDLAVWQKLNVTAFLATGIAAAAPDSIGKPYVDAAGRTYAALLGEPVMILSATPEVLARACRQALDRDLTCAAYVRTMFETGHDAANREALWPRTRAQRTSWVSPCGDRGRTSTKRLKGRSFIREEHAVTPCSSAPPIILHHDRKSDRHRPSAASSRARSRPLLNPRDRNSPKTV